MDMTRKELLRLYVDEDLSRNRIGKLLGLSQDEVRRLFVSLGVYTKYGVDGLWLKISKEELRRLYVDEGYPVNKLVHKLGSTKPTIRSALDSLGIERRGVKEGMDAAREHGHLDQRQMLFDMMLAEQKQRRDERAKRVAADWKSGLYKREAIAARHDVDLSTISKYLKMMGIDGNTVKYRNGAMVSMHKEGKSVAEIASYFNVNVRHLKQILRKGGSPAARQPIKPWPSCLVCGKPLTSSRKGKCCSRKCSFARKTTKNLERNIEIREAKRRGEDNTSLSLRFGICKAMIIKINRRGHFPTLEAVDRIVRHTRAGAVTANARQEIRRAWRYLDGEGIGPVIEQKFGARVKRI